MSSYTRRVIVKKPADLFSLFMFMSGSLPGKRVKDKNRNNQVKTFDSFSMEKNREKYLKIKTEKRRKFEK